MKYIDDDEVKTIKIQSTDFKYMKKVWNVAIKQFVSAKQNKKPDTNCNIETKRKTALYKINCKDK